MWKTISKTLLGLYLPGVRSLGTFEKLRLCGLLSVAAWDVTDSLTAETVRAFGPVPDLKATRLGMLIGFYMFVLFVLASKMYLTVNPWIHCDNDRSARPSPTAAMTASILTPVLSIGRARRPTAPLPTRRWTAASCDGWIFLAALVVSNLRVTSLRLQKLRSRNSETEAVLGVFDIFDLQNVEKVSRLENTESLAGQKWRVVVPQCSFVTRKCGCVACFGEDCRRGLHDNEEYGGMWLPQTADSCSTQEIKLIWWVYWGW